MAARAALTVARRGPQSNHLSLEFARMTPASKPGEPAMSEIATPAAEVGIMPMDLTHPHQAVDHDVLAVFHLGRLVRHDGHVPEPDARVSRDAQNRSGSMRASPIGAMIAPFFVGMIADRFFATQHILAVLHLAGAALLFAVSMVDSSTTLLSADAVVLPLLHADLGADQFAFVQPHDATPSGSFPAFACWARSAGSRPACWSAV